MIHQQEVTEGGNPPSICQNWSYIMGDTVATGEGDCTTRAKGPSGSTIWYVTTTSDPFGSGATGLAFCGGGNRFSYTIQGCHSSASGAPAMVTGGMNGAQCQTEDGHGNFCACAGSGFSCGSF